MYKSVELVEYSHKFMKENKRIIYRELFQLLGDLLVSLKLDNNFQVRKEWDIWNVILLRMLRTNLS